MIVPCVRIEVVGRAGGICATLHARGGTGGLACFLFVPAQQLVQPTHGGSSLARLDTPQSTCPLNAKSGEPEGLPDLARAAYWADSPAVKHGLREKIRKDHIFFFRHDLGAHIYEHTFYDDRSLN